MNIFKDIKELFLPETCAVCGKLMPEGTSFICNYCRWEFPLTGFTARKDNPVRKIFEPHFPVVNCCAFYYFINESSTRELIHGFKYAGAWRNALRMGQWFGSELRSGGLYADVDLVVPVPLHFIKRLRRGYNQSEYIAMGISNATGVKTEKNAVRRIKNNASQTKRRKGERWENMSGIFRVTAPERLAGRHILIVDDVLTTGATVVSMAETILKTVPDCRISIASLAVSKTELDKISR